jgi:hypothetical protein
MRVPVGIRRADRIGTHRHRARSIDTDFGRVYTPTLALMAERIEQTIEGTFQLQNITRRDACRE